LARSGPVMWLPPRSAASVSVRRRRSVSSHCAGWARRVSTSAVVAQPAASEEASASKLMFSFALRSARNRAFYGLVAVPGTSEMAIDPRRDSQRQQLNGSLAGEFQPAAARTVGWPTPAVGQPFFLLWRVPLDLFLPLDGWFPW